KKWWNEETKKIKLDKIYQNQGIVIIISKYLNPPLGSVLSNHGYPKDWKGLYSRAAEDADFKLVDFKNVECAGDKCAKIFDLWFHAQFTDKPTFFDLLDLLHKMERYDLLDDDQFKTPMCRAIEKHLKRLEQEKQPEVLYINQPVQDPKIDSSECEPELVVPVDDMLFAVGDTPERKQHFDAYVSYHEDDLDFVLQLIQKLEKENGKKLFIPDRDLRTSGNFRTVVTAELMEKRCSRVVIVLSEKWKLSPECQFQVKFAQALSNGHVKNKVIVPIRMTDKDDTPLGRYFCNLDYYKMKGNPTTEDWFWKRVLDVFEIQPVQISVQLPKNVWKKTFSRTVNRKIRAILTPFSSTSSSSSSSQMSDVSSKSNTSFDRSEESTSV
ncbi:unnamed protein product, partial [Owenia fusiformis]